MTRHQTDQSCGFHFEIKSKWNKIVSNKFYSIKVTIPARNASLWHFFLWLSDGRRFWLDFIDAAGDEWQHFALIFEIQAAFQQSKIPHPFYTSSIGVLTTTFVLVKDKCEIGNDKFGAKINFWHLKYYCMIKQTLIWGKGSFILN